MVGVGNNGSGRGCKGATALGGGAKGPWFWGVGDAQRPWLQVGCKGATALEQGAEGPWLCIGVQRGHGFGRGGAEGPQPHTHLDGSSSSSSPALRQGSLKSRLKESGNILATSGRRAAGDTHRRLKTPWDRQGGRQHQETVTHEGGGHPRGTHITFGRPAGRVLPQAAAALLEVGTGLPSVPGWDGDLAAAGLAADPARGAAPAPWPPGPHHAAHCCRQARGAGRTEEGKESFNSMKNGRREGEVQHGERGGRRRGRVTPAAPLPQPPGRGCPASRRRGGIVQRFRRPLSPRRCRGSASR